MGIINIKKFSKKKIYSLIFLYKLYYLTNTFIITVYFINKFLLKNGQRLNYIETKKH